MYRSILSLSKIAHQMWRDHPYCQIDMTIEKTLWVGVGVEWKVGMGGVWTKFEKGVQG